MGTHIQWHCEHCGTMRIGKDFHVYGDKYDFSCTVVRKGEGVEFVGGDSEGCNLLCEKENIRKELLKKNIKWGDWVRIKNKQVKKIREYV